MPVLAWCGVGAYDAKRVENQDHSNALLGLHSTMPSACFGRLRLTPPATRCPCHSFTQRECEFLSDGRVLLAAKLISRKTVVESFVEEGTQGLHYCRLEERGDEPLGDEESLADFQDVHRRTRELADRILGPVRVSHWEQNPVSALRQSEAFIVCRTSYNQMGGIYQNFCVQRVISSPKPKISCGAHIDSAAINRLC